MPKIGGFGLDGTSVEIGPREIAIFEAANLPWSTYEDRMRAKVALDNCRRVAEWKKGHHHDLP